MPILSRPQIKKLLAKKKTLIRNAARDESGEFIVEAASYDLRVGTLLWQDAETKSVSVIEFDENKPVPDPFTLQPGQMVFVITHEDLCLPSNVCGTVFSRNKLQKENILALNTGHVDPGYEGPIIIRLINLGLGGWPVRGGDAVFTVVFHTMDVDKTFRPKDRRTKKEMVASATHTALGAFSNPFHDLYKEQISRQLEEHYVQVETKLRIELAKYFITNNNLRLYLSLAVFAIVGLLYTLSRIQWDEMGNWFKWLLNIS